MTFSSLGEASTYTSKIFISISLHLKNPNNSNGRDERLNREKLESARMLGQEQKHLSPLSIPVIF